MKELQTLALDVKVLREDDTAVELKENIDTGDTDWNSIMSGDDYRNNKDENLGAAGYQQQVIEGDEFVAVEEESDSDSDYEDINDDYSEE